MVIGPVVPSDEHCCSRLCSLDDVDVLFEVRIPDDRAVLWEGTDKGEVGISLAVGGAMAEVPS